MILAEIEVPMIIGYDFLYQHDCSIDIKKNCLKLGQKYLKCHSQSEYINKVFRIRLNETVTIPLGAEMIVSGKIDDENQYL